MAPETLYLLVADVILLVHACIVFFVVLAMPLIIVGGLRGWNWVRNPWFRWTHLLGISVVVLQAWLGKLCLLTAWEMHFRRLAADTTYQGSFIAHWIGTLLYYDAPLWVLGVLYTLFGAAVLFAWYWIRPQWFGNR